jgi:hypothetical protein
MIKVGMGKEAYIIRNLAPKIFVFVQLSALLYQLCKPYNIDLYICFHNQAVYNDF